MFNTYVFSIATLGEGSYISDSYSYGYLGYLLAEHNIFLQLANWGGVYALTFGLVALVAVGIYLYPIKRLAPAIMLGALLITANLSVGSYEPLGHKVALVETAFDAEFNVASTSVKLQKTLVIEALDAALVSSADYVVLPEDAHYTNLNLRPVGAYSWFRFQNKDTNAVVVDSGQANLPTGESIMRATVYDGQEKQAWQFDKQYLVPQGEYVPAFFSGLIGLLKFEDLKEALDSKVNYIPGPIVGQSDMPEHLPRVLFCFSSADPKAVKRLVGEAEVPFVAHITSHAWFHQPTILWKQQTAMLKVQAVWSGVAIVQATNMGEGRVYLPTGETYRPAVVSQGERWQVLVTEL